MSRIIVKNLPKNIKEGRLKDIFGKHGDVTQVKLLPKRRFAYIGFLHERDAQHAIEYLHDTFVDTSKIEVAKALAYGDDALPRPWSKYSSGSSANSAREKEKQAARSEFEKQKDAKRREEEDKERAKLSAVELVQREKELLKEIYAVEADPQVNPELHEFLQVMQPGSHKRTWANDSASDANNRVQKKKRVDEPKVSAKIETVKSKKFGGENVTLVRHHITFDESEDSGAEDEYQDLSAAVHSDESEGEGEDGRKKQANGDASTAAAAGEVQGDKLALNSALSDLDWLKAKSSAATAMDVVEEEEEEDEVQQEEEEEAEEEEDPKAEARTSDPSSESDASDGEESPSSSSSLATTKFTIRVRGLPFTATEEEVREFFHPLDLVDVRLPMDRKNRPSGRAYIDLKSAADMDAALKRNGDYLGDRYVEVSKDDGGQEAEDKKPAEPVAKPKRKEYPDLGPDDETLAESGRIFVRNLAYACTEEDLRKLFEPFGPLADVYLPLDAETKKSKAIAFITFVMPEHAVEAFGKLDGQSFQGRLLHLLPAKTKNGDASGVVGVEDGKSSYKKEQAAKKKAKAGDAYNWNTLFIRQDTVADAMADKYGVSKGDVLNIEGSGSLAVRMAMGEAHIVAENKEFLREHGVSLDAFEQGSAGARSKNTILVKNLPFSATEAEIRALFEPYGTLSTLVFPPSHTMALVDYIDSGEARNAFRSLAYRKFKHEPLYLEWAPENTFTKREDGSIALPAAGAKKKGVSKSDAEDEEGAAASAPGGVDSDEGDTDDTRTCTVFVKGLNFETTEDSLRDAFSVIGPIRSVRIATKKNPKNPSQVLSMGFGFVEFRKHDHAINAMKKLQDMSLDGKQLTLKLSHKTSGGQSEGGRERAKTVKGNGTKLIVRNLAFEATKRELMELFSTFGQVKSIRIPTKKFDGSHRGFAFVDFLTKQEAKNAYDSVGTSTHLYGRRLVMEWAKDDESVDAMREKTAKTFAMGASRPKSKRVAVEEPDDL